jgi:zinc/manganese transport system substrate-binding protein
MTKIVSFIFILLFTSLAYSQTTIPTISIVAAENFYGDIANQIGGSHVTVLSILNNPEQDPHLFSANPTIARAVANGKIIIYNGIGYDPWMLKLLGTESGSQQVLVAADLVGAKDGDNPHLWYKPQTSLALAKALAALLEKSDPANKQVYQQNLIHFQQTYDQYTTHIQAMNSRYHGTPVIATEPVFGYLAQALGLNMQGQDFQVSIMNDVPPSPSQIAHFEDAISQHKVKVLFYNAQVVNPVTMRMQKFAVRNNVPIIGVYETEPPGKHYFDWMNDSLTALTKVLK